jgi:hypothetical protein
MAIDVNARMIDSLDAFLRSRGRLISPRLEMQVISANGVRSLGRG